MKGNKCNDIFVVEDEFSVSRIEDEKEYRKGRNIWLRKFNQGMNVFKLKKYYHLRKRKNRYRKLSSFSSLEKENEAQKNVECEVSCCRRARSLSYVERMNSLGDWDVSYLLQKTNDEVSLHVKRNEQRVKGDGFIVELHDDFTKNDRDVLCNTWNSRRHAVHIYDKGHFTNLLTIYMTLRHLASS